LNTTNEIVSFDDEPLILVNPNDEVQGFETKDICHNGQGLLHRAFSVFLFDNEGRVLLQQRSEQKRLWPGFWSNGCCSHPRRGEKMDEAAIRRIREELNLKTELSYLFKFQYQEPFEDKGAEYELCSVYIGRSQGDVLVNETEIAAWKYIPVEELEADMQSNPQHYTPWMKMEWARMRKEFWPQIEKLWS